MADLGFFDDDEGPTPHSGASPTSSAFPSALLTPPITTTATASSSATASASTPTGTVAMSPPISPVSPSPASDAIAQALAKRNAPTIQHPGDRIADPSEPVLDPIAQALAKRNAPIAQHPGDRIVDPSEPTDPIAQALAKRNAPIAQHPGDRIADPNDDPPETTPSPASTSSSSSSSSNSSPSKGSNLHFAPPAPIPSPPLPSNSGGGGGGEALADVVVIPDHYVPLEQIEYLRPADKLRQYATSTVTAHRMYLARSLPYILPKISRQATLNDSLARLFALATDHDSQVRSAAATAVPEMLMAYVATRATPGEGGLAGGLAAVKSTDSLADLAVQAQLSNAMSQPMPALPHSGSAGSVGGTGSTSPLSPLACISLLQQGTPKDMRWNATPLLSSSAAAVDAPAGAAGASHMGSQVLLSPPPSALSVLNPSSPTSSVSTTAVPTFLPMHLLNVTLLPLLVDPVRRIADLTHDHFLRALTMDPAAVRMHFKVHPEARNGALQVAIDGLGRALADWLLRLLSLTPDAAQELVDGAIAAAQAAEEKVRQAVEMQEREKAALKLQVSSAAAASGSMVGSPAGSSIMLAAAGTSAAAVAVASASGAGSSSLSPTTGNGQARNSPKSARFIDHSKNFKVATAGEPNKTVFSLDAMEPPSAKAAASASTPTSGTPAGDSSPLPPTTDVPPSSARLSPQLGGSAPAPDAATLFVHAGQSPVTPAGFNSSYASSTHSLSDDEHANNSSNNINNGGRMSLGSSRGSSTDRLHASAASSYGTAADPHLRSLLFLLTQPAGSAGSGGGGGAGGDTWLTSASGAFGSWSSGLAGHESPPNGFGGAGSNQPPSIQKRVDDMHAALLELVADPIFHPLLSANDRARLLGLIADRFSTHTLHQVRSAAAAAIAACVPLPTHDALERQVYPVMTVLAGDKSYLTRRRAAEACAAVIEQSPAAVQQVAGMALISTVLGDASKNVRDAIYAGLPKIIVAFATGGTDPKIPKRPTSTAAAPVSGPSTTAAPDIVRKGVIELDSGAGVDSDEEDDEDDADEHIDDEPARAALTMDLRTPRAILPGEDDPIFSTPLAVAHLPPRALYPHRVPEELVQSYCLVGMKWKDPDRMARCAYALPGMVATMPSEWWTSRFRSLFMTLARDPLMDLRRPLMAAADVFARVVPRSCVAVDIVPVVQDWLAREEDQTKSQLYAKLPGILAQIEDPADIPIELLRVPMDLLVSNENWHLRRVCARTLPSWLELYLRPGVLTVLESKVPAATTATDATSATSSSAEAGADGKATPKIECDDPMQGVEPSSVSTSQDPAKSPLDRAWAVLAPILMTLLADPVTSVRFSAAASLPDLADQLAPAHRSDLVSRITAMAEADHFHDRMAAATAVALWTPAVVGSSALMAEMGAPLGAVLAGLARDRVLDVRLQISGTFAHPLVATALTDAPELVSGLATPPEHADALVHGLVAAKSTLVADTNPTVRERAASPGLLI
ncbi:hypothetical protein BCR44DRAFT_366912 [Catenaria anguillulae PL171]|uniref:Armadillo-type protein n=1 Tax=Catenaria anguillulae PL171 TaxID=765915 RepID=A0A1Y2HF81_9FUNG|nr:hypothetical protein BCR44DRAFT_366912 [Catenaria anguillulae PL171]